MSEEDTDELFRVEAQQLTESLETGLLDLRNRPNDKVLIDSVFRDLHTLKGTGSMFGHDDLAQFLHDFETTFDAVREGRLAVSDRLIELGLKARDHVQVLLDGGPTEGGSDLLVALKQLVGEGGDAAPQSGGPGQAEWSLQFGLAADTLQLGGRPEAILAELKQLGATDIRPVLEHIPRLSEITPDQLYLGWQMRLPGHLEKDAVDEVFLFHTEGLDIQMERIGQGSPPAPMADNIPEETGSDPVQSGRENALMRVSAERLDDMMDRVGELVIAEARLAELASRSGDPQLVAVAEEIQRLATGMRETTMSIRMTPIGSVSGRFRRLVHDLTQTLGKDIQFDLSGQETELDKTVIEMLTDPLMHLIRNAADHGMEEGETRRNLGKPETGTICLSARYSGAEVVITLSDDGAGLDLGRIRDRAVERGLISAEGEYSEAELSRMILEPGFSTAETITSLSGRGVGMDVVKRTIDQLRGHISVESEPGHGTAIHMRLPLTLAIIDGLLVEVGGERYTIPLAAVEHIIELPENKAREDGTTRFLHIRDQLVPFLRMRELLDSPGSADPFQKVVVVTAGDLRVGVTVDRIIGSSQTVIKQLSPLLSGIKTFSGATILGDGTVALILDVPQLVAFGQTLDARDVA